MLNHNLQNKLKKIRNYTFLVCFLISLSFFISVFINYLSVENHHSEFKKTTLEIKPINNTIEKAISNLYSHFEEEKAIIIRNHLIFWFLGIGLTFLFSHLIKKEVHAYYKSEKKFESLFDAAPFPIVLHSDGKLVYTNDEANKTMEAYDLDSIIGKNILEFVHPDSLGSVKKRMLRLYSGESEVDIAIEKFVTAKGNTIFVEVKAKRVNFNGLDTAMVIFHNVTEKQIWLDKLSASEANLKSLLNNNRISFILFDSNRNTVFYNSKSVELFEKIISTPINGEETIKNFFNSNAPEEFVFHFNEALKGEKSVFENEHKTKNGELLFLHHELNPVKTENDEITGVVLASTDVTSLKISELNLKESRERLKVIYDNTNIGILLTNSLGIIEYINPAFSKIINYPKNELVGKPIIDFSNLVDYDNEMKFINELKNGIRNSFTIEKRYIKKNKEEVWTQANITCSRNDDNSIKYVTGIIEDITDRKQTEAEMKKINLMKDILSNSIVNSPLGMILWEVEKNDTTIIDWNSASEKIFGWKKNEVLNKSFFDLITILPGLTQENQPNSVQKNENYPSCYLTESKTKNGDEIIINLHNTAMYDNDSCVIRIMSLVQDVTQEKLIEKELIKAKEEAEKADRLKSEFLAQMSHEIRTPINAMLSFSSLIREDVKDYNIPDLEDSFDIINSAGNRIVRTADLLINMAEIQTNTHDFNPQVVDINDDVLLNIYKLLKPFAEQKHLDFNFTNEAEKTKVFADETMLRVIFDNVIDNAIKFTKKGNIDIKVSNYQNNKLRVTIQDTGIGISEEYLKNIYTPFSQEESGYTRKFEGNGLGLALVKKYCDFNRAKIIITSEKGIGTSFTIELNLA